MMNELQLYEYLDVPVPIGSAYVQKLLNSLDHSLCIDDEGCEFAVHTLDFRAAYSILEQVAEHLEMLERDHIKHV